MQKSTANQLATAVRDFLPNSAQFELLESNTSLILENFSGFANGCSCFGAFLIAQRHNPPLWLLIIDWKRDGNYYLVLYPKDRGSPIAELHNQGSGQRSVDLTWTYQPTKQDKRNGERREAFRKAFGRLDCVVSLPSALVTLDDFLADVFRLASLRTAADRLEDADALLANYRFPEGRRIERLHKSRERDSEVVMRAKHQHAKRHDGALPCQVCGFDFVQFYGSLGESYIEAHHIRPLSELSGEESQNTRVEDLSLVCANCHRMLHRRRPWASIDQLKNSVREKT